MAANVLGANHFKLSLTQAGGQRVDTRHYSGYNVVT